MKPYSLLISALLLASLGSVLSVRAADPAETNSLLLSRLRQIGMGCVMYATENRGFMPSNLGQIVRYQPNLPEVFLDPRGATQPPTDWATMTDEQKQTWATEHSEFLLTDLAGKKITKVKIPSSAPMAIAREGQDGRLAVLFVDGHVVLFEPTPVHPATQPGMRPMRRATTMPATRP